MPKDIFKYRLRLEQYSLTTWRGHRRACWKQRPPTTFSRLNHTTLTFTTFKIGVLKSQAPGREPMSSTCHNLTVKTRPPAVRTLSPYLWRHNPVSLLYSVIKRRLILEVSPWLDFKVLAFHRNGCVWETIGRLQTSDKCWRLFMASLNRQSNIFSLLYLWRKRIIDKWHWLCYQFQSKSQLHDIQLEWGLQAKYI